MRRPRRRPMPTPAAQCPRTSPSRSTCPSHASSTGSTARGSASGSSPTRLITQPSCSRAHRHRTSLLACSPARETRVGTSSLSRSSWKARTRPATRVAAWRSWCIPSPRVPRYCSRPAGTARPDSRRPLSV
ncbi:hypothetical protein ACFPRL_18230 [Pseudoclavibacter helvolus]